MKRNGPKANSSIVELEEKLVKITTMLDNTGYQDIDKLHNEIDNITQYALAGSEIGFWCLNECTKKLFFSKNWEEFLGYSKEELKELTLDKLIENAHTNDLGKFNNFITQIYSGNSNKDNHELLMRIKHKEKGWGNILIRGKILIKDNIGISKFAFGTYMDVSDFMQADIERQDFYNMTENLHKNLPGFLYKYRLDQNKKWSLPYLSDNVWEIFGLKPEEGVEHPSLFFNIILPEEVEDVRKSIAYSIKNLKVWKKSFRINHPIKGICWIESHATPQLNADGTIDAYGYAYDATELHQIRESANLASRIYENTNDGVLMVGSTGKITKINPAICLMSGYSEKELIGQNPAILSSGRHDQSFYKTMYESVINDGYWQGEIISKRKNGDNYTSLLTIEAVADVENIKLKNYIATFTDISELKERNNELTRLENYDYLTNLPNRRLLLEKLESALIDAESSATKVVVCFIDLDEFKPINDKYGHSFGDRFLCHVSEELIKSVRPQDTVARLGGDEFVVVLNDIKNDNDLNNLINALTNTCNKTFEILSEKITLSASMGIVVYPNVKGNADELIRFADQAMYKAKQQGRNRSVFFDSQKEDASIAHYLKLEQVRAALVNDEFTLWYQPKVDVATNKVLGVEALIRWVKPDGKIIPAVDFINIIEGDALDYQIGRFVIERALKDQSAWIKNGFDIAVSVNISSDHLLHPNFEKDLKTLIKKYASNPKLIILEILETSRISDFDVVIERLRSCLKLGVCFSLDDFGTGYSSLGYLRALPTQEVKIDKSFIFSMLKESQDKMIVQGIIDLSHALGRVVVAEGVETDDHMSELKKMGADLIQGYGVSRPMPEPQLLAWIGKWNDKT
jgi:diguanylate cyclase (GGDEF)-like protein/PAS domain S-box-containing protein